MRGTAERAAIGDLTPVLNAFFGLPDERIGRVCINPEKRCDFSRKIEIKDIVVFRDIESKTGTIRIGIDVVGRREYPALRRQQETVVAEMVVSILHCDTKNDSFPEFPQVGVRLSAVLHDEFGNIKVTGSVLIIGSIRFAKQCHCRSEMNAAVAVAVETPGQESRAIFGELVKLAFRQTEADLPC